MARENCSGKVACHIQRKTRREGECGLCMCSGEKGTEAGVMESCG